jgi:hypothetical protein
MIYDTIYISSNNKTLNARLLARVITGFHYTKWSSRRDFLHDNYGNALNIYIAFQGRMLQQIVNLYIAIYENKGHSKKAIRQNYLYLYCTYHIIYDTIYILYYWHKVSNSMGTASPYKIRRPIFYVQIP